MMLYFHAPYIPARRYISHVMDRSAPLII